MPHPLSHKYPIPTSQLCLVNTDVQLVLVLFHSTTLFCLAVGFSRSFSCGKAKSVLKVTIIVVFVHWDIFSFNMTASTSFEATSRCLTDFWTPTIFMNNECLISGITSHVLWFNGNQCTTALVHHRR